MGYVKSMFIINKKNEEKTNNRSRSILIKQQTQVKKAIAGRSEIKYNKKKSEKPQ